MGINFSKGDYPDGEHPAAEFRFDTIRQTVETIKRIRQIWDTTTGFDHDRMWRMAYESLTGIHNHYESRDPTQLVWSQPYERVIGKSHHVPYLKSYVTQQVWEFYKLSWLEFLQLPLYQANDMFKLCANMGSMRQDIEEEQREKLDKEISTKAASGFGLE